VDARPQPPAQVLPQVLGMGRGWRGRRNLPSSTEFRFLGNKEHGQQAEGAVIEVINSCSPVDGALFQAFRHPAVK
jgi:hypothetical protein